MVKSKKQMYIIIGVFTLVMMLGTVTYAFFNYTRTGSANTIKVGRISFVSKNEETITLTNLFPIDPSESGIMNDSTKVGTYSIEIKGDTDYVDGIEYLVSATDANIYTNQGQAIPINLDMTVEDLGTASPNYWTARESKNATIYKKLVGDTLIGDQMLLVGYIKKNTTSGNAEGVDGSITIKAYLDKNKILISDTYDGTESDNMGTTNNQAEGKTVITTSEWNALQSTGVSFKVKVEANEGIWVEEPTAYNMIKNNAVTNQSINFTLPSSPTNGEGLYQLSGTGDNAYPIYYYRGNINDNNVIFGGYCWQMIRTTDTGGIKMIYNGVVTGNGKTCENTSHYSRILFSTQGSYNNYSTSLADIGYMNNVRYETKSSSAAANAYYGTYAEYGDFDNDGNNEYRLIDDGVDSVVQTKNNMHHYSCNLTSATGTCTTIRYYFYGSNYIELENGEFIEDAVYKMTGNGSDDVKLRNSGYILNENNSSIKTTIDNWFKTYLTNEVDANNPNYVDYIEDTLYCNDRTFGSGEIRGFDPNGGLITVGVRFNSGSKYSSWTSTTIPDFACPNETDRFSVSSSVAHLNYPVGLINYDEAILTGISSNSIQNTSFFLNTGDSSWVMSPDSYNGFYFIGGTIAYNGTSSGYYLSGYSGIRPVISLKPRIAFEPNGNGTPTNPYVVKY